MERWSVMEQTQAQAMYRLTIIEEEQVPLAAIPEMSSNMPAVVLSIIMALLMWVLVYLVRCRDYQKRIEELDKDHKKYHGWRLSRLRETVGELEAEKIEKKFLENVSLFV